jgi:AcrR family transcriptional regulator
MPKLRPRAMDQNRERIERAAIRVFTKQGFHGTSVRDLALAAGVSMGNLYNYYPTKDDLFRRVIERFESKIEGQRQRALGPLDDLFNPDELRRLAYAVKDIVYENPDYWRLMYIDIIEFGNRHFAHTFRSLAKNLQQRLGPQLERSIKKGRWSGVNPALAFTALYLQFFTYFLVEKLFGGDQHLGMSDDLAVDQIIKMVTEGLWRHDSKGKRFLSGRGKR